MSGPFPLLPREAAEAATMDASDSAPQTRQSILAGLRELGLREGSVLLVHSSLRSLGWVCGGGVAVIQALIDALGEEGTLAMPAHSGELSDPSNWSYPPVPEAWWATIRETMPAFEPAITPTRGIGRIPELFRSWPGTLRSSHPQVSFAARGPAAAAITASHSLEDGLGPGSPLARLREERALVLHLGSGWESTTAFHLAEYECEWRGKKEVVQASPLLRDVGRAWTEYRDINYNSDDFGALGADLEAGGRIARGRVGRAPCLLFDLGEAVEFAKEWLPGHR
jgi:aminoglycoside 3-N-acetyltransferase